MKRALIIHGWGSSPKKKWFHREKLRLEKLGYVVTIPKMPHTYFPNKEKWEKIIIDFKPDSDTTLIGQSLGGTLILDYFEKTDVQVGGVVLTAMPIVFVTTESISGFLHTLIISLFCYSCGYKRIVNWLKIKQNVDKIELVYKKLDFRGPITQGNYIANKLGCDCKQLSGKDHMDKINLDVINEELS